MLLARYLYINIKLKLTLTGPFSKIGEGAFSLNLGKIICNLSKNGKKKLDVNYILWENYMLLRFFWGEGSCKRLLWKKALTDITRPDNNLCLMMERTFQCKQVTSKVTTDYNSILDLVFTNCDGRSGVIQTFWSEHKLINFRTPFNKTPA